MATNTYIIYKIRKYQRLIEENRNDKDQILHCVTKLFKLPMEVGYIQETGIDKTVNSIREFGGEVDGIVNSLVQKWKKLTLSEVNLVANGERNKRNCDKLKSEFPSSTDKLEPASKLAKSRTHKHKSTKDRSEQNSETGKETKSKRKELRHHQKLEGNSDKRSPRDSRSDRKSLETSNKQEIQKNNDDKSKKSIENVKEGQKIDRKSSNSNKRKRDTSSDGEHKDYSAPKKQQRVNHIETDDHRSRDVLVNKANVITKKNKSSITSTTTTNASKCLRSDNTNTSSTAILEPRNQSIHVVLNANPLAIGNPVPCKQKVKYEEKDSLEKSKAFLDGITSKTTRTKLYSGVKSDKVFQPPSLLHHCIRLLQKDIAGLKYTGNVSFDILKPVLEQATPQQLLKLEDHNPYLMEDSDSLWKFHVERQYRTQRRQNMETWREMFHRCQEEEKRKLSKLTETFKQQKLNEIPVRKVQLASDDSQFLPPRGIRCRKLAAIPVAPLTEISSVRAQISNARRSSAWETMKRTMKVQNTSQRPKPAPLMAKTIKFYRAMRR